MLEECLDLILSNKKNLTNKLRFTNHEIFLFEEATSFITSTLNRRNYDKGVILSYDEIKERIGLDSRNLFYIEEDKLIISHKIPKKIFIPSPPFIPLRGNLISCSNYVHPCDPLFEGKNLKIYPQKGIIATIFSDNQNYELTVYAHNKFKQRIEKSSQIEKDFFTSRESLELFYTMFIESKPAIRRNNILQLMKNNFQDSEYRIFSNKKLGNWVFAINKKDRLIKTVYEKHEIKNLYRLVS